MARLKQKPDLISADEYFAGELSAYVRHEFIVEQSQKRLEVYRKRTGWKQEFLHPDDPLVLDSIGQTLTFDQIYRNVIIKPEPEDF